MDEEPWNDFSFFYGDHMTDQELKDAIDELHSQLHGLVDHQTAPPGTAAGTFNFAAFLANAIKIFQAVWPILGPLILSAAQTSPDPALPTKTP